MKKAIVFAVVAVVVLIGYRQFTAETPEKVYKEFATSLIDGDYARAAELSEGWGDDDWKKINPLFAIGFAMIQDTFRPLYSMESERQISATDVEIKAMQAVQFNPPGVESAMRPAMVAKVGQTVRLKKTNDGWKVVAFENDVRSIDSLLDK